MPHSGSGMHQHGGTHFGDQDLEDWLEPLEGNRRKVTCYTSLAVGMCTVASLVMADCMSATAAKLQCSTSHCKGTRADNWSKSWQGTPVMQTFAFHHCGFKLLKDLYV